MGTGLVALAMVAAITVLASTSSSAQTTAPGTIDCTSVTGNLTFPSPLGVSPNAASMTGTLRLNDCVVGSASGRRPLAFTTVPTGRAKISAMGTISCGELTGNPSLLPVVTTWTTRWTTQKGTASTISTFNGFASTPELSLSYPGPGDGVSATGSYTGIDAGSSSFLNLDYTVRPNICTPTGHDLKTLKVKSGQFFSG